MISLDRVARDINVTVSRDPTTWSWTFTRDDGRTATLTLESVKRLETESAIAAEISRMLEES